MSGTQPACYGKHWNPQSVECRGGLDPLYTNPIDGSHRRDKCSWYETCAPRTCAAQIPSQQQPPAPQGFVPQQNLVRSGPTLAAPVLHQPPARPMMPWQQPQQQQQQPGFAQLYFPHQQNMAPAYMVQFGQQQLPMNFQQPGMQIPAYLTVPEPVDFNIPWWQRLGIEVARSMVKGAAHSVANWVDHNPFGRYNPPPAP
jgi:hypothetical protein